MHTVTYQTGPQLELSDVPTQGNSTTVAEQSDEGESLRQIG